MKLLLITQKVDKNDDLLGVYHEWIGRLAEKYDFINVICLQKGEDDLPDNVRVFSLGKPANRAIYILNFYKYIWKLRNDYDAVFVHMNPEYIVLAGLFWKFLGTKIYLWYNHAKGNIKTRIAFMFSEKIFYTSEFAFAVGLKKSQIMPVGIDINLFKVRNSKHEIRNSILSLGRISPVKHIDVLIEALKMFDDFTASIYGDPTDKDGDYYKKIRENAKELEVKKKITFYGSVANNKTSEIYGRHDIFINLTPSGSFDKTIIEAMSAGCLPIVCNESLRNVLDNNFFFKEGDAEDLAKKIKKVFNLSESEKEKYREKFRNYVKENHSLDKLINKLTETIK